MFVFIIEDLKDRGIEIKNCRYYQKCNIPLSTVLLSKDTGCRTIIHTNKNLPHVKFEDFDKCDLSEYFWVHFEARSVNETFQMMQKIRSFNQKNGGNIKISLELEKKRDENLLLIKHADVAIIGKDYAEILGCHDKKTAVYKIKDLISNDEKYKNENCILICPFGTEGACAIDVDGNYFESPIFPNENVVDTLGKKNYKFCKYIIIT
jgi:ketohexokinase